MLTIGKRVKTAGRVAGISIVLAAVLGGSPAQADPIEAVRAALERKYPRLTQEIRSYLALYGTEDAVKFEKEMGEVAIRAASVGDYSALYRFERGGAARVKRAHDLLGYGGGWNAYWRGLDATARRTLLQNPMRFVSFMDILQSFDTRPDLGAIRQALQEHPSLLVILRRVPAIAEAAPANREKLLPFLLGLDYGGPEEPFERLNSLVQSHSQALIALLEDPQGGPAAAMTLWAVPEIFDDPNCTRIGSGTPPLSVWPAVAAQGKFIRDLRATSSASDWPKKVATLRDVFRCSSVHVSNRNVLLLMMLNPGGELLEQIYRAKRAETAADFELLTDFFEFCVDWNLELLPGKVVWATSASEERRAMMEVAMDKRFIRPNQRADRRLIPLGALAILQFGRNSEFRKLLVKHKSQLVLYLYKDGNPQAALRDAARFHFADVAWDESWYRSASGYLPFGEIVNICVKSWNEYPIDRKEWVGAMVDAADLIGTIATAGMSQAASGPLSMTAKEAAQKVAQTTLTSTLKENLKSIGQDYVREDDAQKAGDLARTDSHDVRASQAAAKLRAREFQNQVALLQAMTADYFGIPYKAPGERKADYVLGKETITNVIPAAPDPLAEAIRTDDPVILLVTLAQFESAQRTARDKNVRRESTPSGRGTPDVPGGRFTHGK